MGKRGYKVRQEPRKEKITRNYKSRKGEKVLKISGKGRNDQGKRKRGRTEKMGSQRIKKFEEDLKMETNEQKKLEDEYKNRVTKQIKTQVKEGRNVTKGKRRTKIERGESYGGIIRG